TFPNLDALIAPPWGALFRRLPGAALRLPQAGIFHRVAVMLRTIRSFFGYKTKSGSSKSCRLPAGCERLLCPPESLKIVALFLRFRTSLPTTLAQHLLRHFI